MRFAYGFLSIVGLVCTISQWSCIYLSGDWTNFGQSALAMQVGLWAVQPISAFILTQFLLSQVVFLVWIFPESRRLGMNFPFFTFLSTVIFGLAFSLPFFLWQREPKVAHRRWSR